MPSGRGRAARPDSPILLDRGKDRWWNKLMRRIAKDQGVSVQDLIFEEMNSKYREFYPEIEEFVTAEENLRKAEERLTR